MGLPIFVNPPSPTAPSVVEKSTAGPRSSIRRHRTARGPHARLTAESRRRRNVGMGLDSGLGYYPVWERQRQSPPDEPESAAIASIIHTRVPRARSLNERFRDSYERRHAPDAEIDGPMMPPVPEMPPQYRAESERRARERDRMNAQDTRRAAGRRTPAPTPPYGDSDTTLMGRIRADALSQLSMTQRLSPPNEPHLRLAESENLDEIAATLHGMTSPYGLFRPRSIVSINRPSRADISERVQALNNRMSEANRTLQARRDSNLDGLGDRDRSLSPEGGAAWDTLLTSITPDPQPPSVGSSFASASASAAASTDASANTSMTSMGMSDTPPALHDCDISGSSSELSDIEDDMLLLPSFRNRARGDRFWRTYADVVSSRSEDNPSDRLDGMHRIITRLASREDIPDSWWAEAGLRREPTN